MFIKALVYPERLSLGISLISNEIRYALVYRGKNGKFDLIFSGNGIPIWLSCITPLFTHTDLSKIPVIINTEKIGQEDPDAWIERHDTRANTNQSDNLKEIEEYLVDGSTVYQVHLSTKARDELIQKFGPNFQICTLSPPLWKLAGLYWERKPHPFILWKISRDGSVIGRIDNGKVEKICNFWSDTEDLQQDPHQVLQEISPLISSLSSSQKLPVIVFSPEIDFTIPTVFSIGEIKFENPPEIKGILPQNHEVYALACHNRNELNFVPFERVQFLRSFRSIWNAAVKATRWFIYLIIISVLILLGIDKGSDLYVHLNSVRLAGVKEQIVELKNAYSERDSVMVQFKEKARFIADESKVTNLLSDFQEIFPEGMRAEEITISGNEDRSYQIDIRAIASSSGMIGTLMERLGKIQGITGCRMIYSEQIPAQQEIKGIRVKIQANWR